MRNRDFDIVTRLREGRSNGTDLRWTVTPEHREAADEIERLRAALDEALEVVKPFTERAEAWKHNADSARVSVHLADLRAARRFYEKHRGGGR